MALNFGSATPSAYYLGSNAVSEVYFGDTKVWPVGIFGQEIFHIDISSSLSYTWPTASNNQQYIYSISPNKFLPIITGSGGTAASASSEALRYSITSSTVIVEDPSGSGRVMRFGDYFTFGGGQNNWLQFYNAGNNLTFISNSLAGYSFEFWVRPYTKTVPDISPLYSSLQQFSLNISSPGTNDGALYIRNSVLGQDASSQSLWTPPNAVTFGRWNHIVMSAQNTGISNVPHRYTSASINLYVNGVKMSAQSSSQHVGTTIVYNNSSQVPMIGRDRLIYAGDKYAKMDLSQFKIYNNKVLSDEDVLTLYDNTKARYGFNEYSGSTIEIDPATYDGSGFVYNTVTSNPLTGSITGLVQYTSSVAGGVFNFARTSIYNPNTNYIQFPTYDFGNEATFMAWVYPKGQLPGGSIQTLLANTTNFSESNGFKLTWDALFAEANAMGFENGNGFAGAPYNTTTGSVVDNQWQHLAWAYNKNTSTINIYRNGILRPYKSYDGGPTAYDIKNFATNNQFVIGAMFERNPPPTVNYEFQMNAMLGVVKITNVELPIGTILDDFNATRARYGV